MLIRFWSATSWENVYKCLWFCPPCLKTITTLPCEICKSYSSSLQRAVLSDVHHAANGKNVSWLGCMFLWNLYTSHCYVYSVLKYACASWTMNSDLIRRINAFEQWCYRRILKIKWTDRILNAEVMQRMKVSEMCLYKSIQKQKMAFAGHVLRGSSGGKCTLVIRRQNGCSRGTRKTKTYVDWWYKELDKMHWWE